ncbi:alpha/beta fold hydrolase [Ruegeria sp. Ofav3-42]|uniref:alpha/beta fold hydrolase n=1 Tax=Ruegeria sp. Ofav3-42 TaxID=2917759 RepID=UPI001EF69A21|nr:alpha/beta hydrolase [Ruegeria sp. Ofav3-42]MCG7518532.1 alpha/beta hydrolase [Ruegeria sp. Ofav3-42]
MTWTTRPRSDIGDLAAIEAGQGPLVVLLHGVGLRAEAWGAQIDALSSAGYRVLCLDMPGHGESPFRDPIGLEGYARPVSELLTEPVVLVGHSMGALIALNIAASGHEHVRGVAALNAVYRRSPESRQAVLSRAAALDDTGTNDPTATLQRWFGGKPSQESAACSRWLKEANPAGYKAAYTVFAESDGLADSQLAQIECPALFVTGEEEPNSTPRMSRDMARLAPKGQAEVIADAAHMMPMTHPFEVNSSLLRFVRRCLP